MKNQFGYTILYVQDVEKALLFYENAFGFNRRFLHESGAYGELETGQTTLAFASLELAQENIPLKIQKLSPKHASAFEIAFTTQDVASSFEQALKAGAIEVAPPQLKPWGQTVAYVQDEEGMLIEIASEMK
jgi:lactoylglutathione lyase